MLRARGKCRPRGGDVVVMEALEGRVMLSGAWKFMVFADTQGASWPAPVNSAMVSELARAAVREGVDVILVPGDLTFQGGLSQFNEWKAAMKPAYKAGIKIYPLRGDHDYVQPDFLKAFGKGLPKNGTGVGDSVAYSFTHKNSLFLGLDETSPANAQMPYDWIRRQIAASDAVSIFAFGHRPAFKLYHSDPIGYNLPGDRDTFWSEMQAAGVKAYFCGHEHFYDHTRLDDGDGNPNNDVNQIIAGTGGGGLYSDASYDGDNGPWMPVRIAHDQSHGYVLAEVSGSSVTMTFKRRTADNVFEPGDTFTITGDGPGHSPTANADSVQTMGRTPATFNVLANDTDTVDQRWLSVESFGKARGGKVKLNGDGTFTFTAKKGFSGATSFTYTIEDLRHGSSTATVNVQVYAPPVAKSDKVRAPVGQPVIINVLTNDKESAGGGLSVIGFTQPADGELVLNSDGTFTYTRATKGRRTFTYTVADGRGAQATGKVTIR